jgi:hypothetical protein
MTPFLSALLLLQPALSARVMPVDVGLTFTPGQWASASSVIDPKLNWTEVVPSWNLDNAESAALTLEARVIYPDKTTKWYSFGRWTLDSTLGPRASVEGQKDDDGNVLTDTLRVTRPGGQLELRVLGWAAPNKPLPRIKRLTLSFFDPIAAPATAEPHKQAWGTLLEPPQDAQGFYPNGKVLCSPTCVSMSLGYWAKELGNPDLIESVPAAQSKVWDHVYKGAGNWSFNMALAGSKPGMVAYCARLSNLAQLERWIVARVPVACSVSWYLLHGQPLQKDENGHIVVLVGFTKDGDPVFNDPGDRKQTRKSYKRTDFEAAWKYSKRTSYLIYPESYSIPSPENGEWLEH